MNDFDETFDGVEHAAAERSASLAVRMARRAVLRQLRALRDGRLQIQDALGTVAPSEIPLTPELLMGCLEAGHV